ncbi:hypothetical protein [Parvibacter caecicola]|uniref:hypothetical protein n=1 Tax=Parvibacter caecicola TaxID=747645 RepID=UPI002731AC6A|nr:hypothetical protein [Parvibacter caecicola]
MGLFKKGAKLVTDKVAAGDGKAAAVARVVSRVAFQDNAPAVSVSGPDCDYDYEEERRLKEEGFEIRRARIREMGVDVEALDAERVTVDALGILNEFSPEWRKLNLDLDYVQVKTDFPNLTKTGKLPKNVFSATLCADDRKVGYGHLSDMAIVSLKYLSDSTVNMADVHLWRNGIRVGYSVRRVQGEFRITSITSTDMRREVDTTIYNDAAPQDKATGMSMLSAAVKMAWGL